MQYFINIIPRSLYLIFMLFYRTKLWKKAEADRNQSSFDQVKKTQSLYVYEI